MQYDIWDVDERQRDKILNLSGYMFEQSRPTLGICFQHPFTRKRPDASTMSQSIVYDALNVVCSRDSIRASS